MKTKMALHQMVSMLQVILKNSTKIDMKTKIDIIEETVAFYSEDVSRRSVYEEQGFATFCVYCNPENKKCALGRCLTEESLDMLAERGCNSRSASAIFELPWVKLKPEYAHIKDVGFWQDLQNIHDRSSYWDKDGLTQKGKQLIDALKADHR